MHWHGFCNKQSHRFKAGVPTVLTAQSAATNSASGVEWDTAVCFFERACIGKHVSDPDMTKNAPLVLLPVRLHPAKSASANRCNEIPSTESPTHPTSLRCKVELT